MTLKSTIIFIAVIALGLAGVSANVHAETEGTITGAIGLYLFESGTGSDQTGNNKINAKLGDIITIDVYARNPSQVAVAGIELYFTVDDRYFDIVPQGYNTEKDEYNGQPRPFIQGDFLRSAQGVVQRFGNNTHGDTLTAMDNKISGWQMNYVEITGTGEGGGRPVSRLPFGVIATFQLRAKAICDSIPISLDINQFQMRISRYIDPYASYSYYFKSFTTCYISVTGIGINPPLPDILLAPGKSDSSIDLDDHIELSSVADSLLVWEAYGNENIGVSIDPKTHVVTFQAPLGFRGYENVTFIVHDAKNTITASDILRVTVDSAPYFVEPLPSVLNIHEDSLETVMYLPAVIKDDDEQFKDLTVTITPGENLTYQTVADSLLLKGTLNFNGQSSVTIIAADSFALADTVTIPVTVIPVNDAPVVSDLPDVKLPRNDTLTLTMSNYAADIDGDALTYSWLPTSNFVIKESHGVITIQSTADFLGIEDVTLIATDTAGLSGQDTMAITVTPSAKPPVWSKLPKVGFAQGRADSSLVLWNYVTDPDDPDSLLTFEVTNYDDIDYFEINERNGKLILYDIDNKPGWDKLTITAYDPDGNYASTECIVFVAPADGTPIVGGIPDTTIVAGTQSVWIDLDDYYYDIDNTDNQMKWTWGRMAAADSAATFFINPSSHVVSVKSIAADRFGEDRIYFTVTDPSLNYGDDICSVTVLKDLSKPVLTLPPKVGFVAGKSDSLDLDKYVSDSMYQKSQLSWNWSGNTKSTITLGQPTQLRSRPVTFSGPEGWIGWERVAFIVTNPLGGAALDTLTVFSVSSDGTPLAGGLMGVTLKAGECVSVYLDDYFYDADSADYTMQWKASGGDSVTVTVDPLSHIAQICAHSLTWQGQEILTFTVTDPGGKSASMNVPVTVTDALLRNVITARIFRNPMQEDYMEMYVTAKTSLSAVPAMSIIMGSDSSKVVLTSLLANYYRGRYVLPLEKSLGYSGVADAVMTAVTTDGRSVQDTTRFAYGYLGAGGGKIALGPMTVDVPYGSLASPVWMTITDETSEEIAAPKVTASELVFDSTIFRLEPVSCGFDKPVTVSFDNGGRSTGVGIFRITSTGSEYIGSVLNGTTVSANSGSGGVFCLGYDSMPPKFGSVTVREDGVFIPVVDFGAGVDSESISVVSSIGDVTWSFNADAGMLTVFLRDIENADEYEFTVTASDRTGNISEKTVAVDAGDIPGMIFVGQNQPNPFNPETHIPFTITSGARVTVVVYDLLGRKIRDLADEQFSAGQHSLRWDARDNEGRTVSSGVYVYTIQSGGRSFARKMMLLR